MAAGGYILRRHSYNIPLGSFYDSSHNTDLPFGAPGSNRQTARAGQKFRIPLEDLARVATRATLAAAVDTSPLHRPHFSVASAAVQI